MRGKIRLVSGADTLQEVTTGLVSQGYRVAYHGHRHVMLVRNHSPVVPATIVLLIGATLVLMATGAVTVGAALFGGLVPPIVLGALARPRQHRDVVHLVVEPQPTGRPGERWRIPEQTERGYYLA